MRPIIVMALGILLSACAPRIDDRTWIFSDKASVPVHQEVEVTVSVVPDPVMEYAGVCEQLEAASREQGVEELLHMIVGQAPVLLPAGGHQGVTENGMAVGVTQDVQRDQHDQCDPWLDPVTGMVRQRSVFAATLVPEQRFGGVIDALQRDKTMGGMLSRAYVTLWGDSVGREPVPVVIVQQTKGLGGARDQGLVQVVGSGLIFQRTDAFGQLHILESTREIFPGDLFFQLHVQATVLPMVGDLLPLALEEEE